MVDVFKVVGLATDQHERRLHHDQRRSGESIAKYQRDEIAEELCKLVLACGARVVLILHNPCLVIRMSASSARKLGNSSGRSITEGFQLA